MKKLALLLLVLFPFFAHADDDVLRNTISVTGEAGRKLAPDQATLNITVYTQNPKLAEAKKSNNVKLQKLLELAHKAGARDEDIKTQYSNVYPEYEYTQPKPGEASKRVFKYYVATTDVLVMLGDIERVGGLMDGLVEAGFDRIGNINFDLKDKKKIQEDMLADALRNAKEKAGKMAVALGQGIGKAIIIADSGVVYAPPQPVYRAAMMKAEAADGSSMPTGVPAGLIELRQTVNVMFELQ